MKITKQARRDAKSLLRTCQVDGLLDENRVRTTVDLLLAEKPRGFLAMLRHFQRLVKLDLARRSAKIESAVALGSEDQAKIKNQLQTRYGAGLVFDFSVNPALLGGVRVKVGSDVYDGSVQGRLGQLQQLFEAA